MDSSFRCDLVKDATIADITDDLTFSCEAGAANLTFQSFGATSPSNSSLVFSVQLPSESIVMGRDILIRAGLTFMVNVGGVANPVPVGQVAFKYGVDSALAPFPLSSIITTASVQINNTNVSCNMGDIFPQLLCLNSREHLAYYNGMTPSLPDGDFASYADALGATNNPLAGYSSGGYDNRIEGRGAYPVKLTVGRYNAGGVYQDASLISTALTDSWKIAVQTSVTEPLFLSPFTWGDPVKNAQGLCGINNLSCTFNIDGGLRRLFSSASSYINWPVVPGCAAIGALAAQTSLFAAPTGLVPGQVSDLPTLLLKFLSTQASDIIKSKNVVPYSDMPRFLSQYTAVVDPYLAGGAPVRQTSQNLQLNQIPSKILICVRKPLSAQTGADSSTFLTITGLSVNFNNASGLLSSSSQQDLWRMSARNGSNQTWM